jgi:hypothetical protein
MTTISFVCILDFSDEVDIANGDARYWEEHVVMCKRFCDKHSGTLQTETSQAITASFSQSEMALRFAVSLLQTSSPQPGYASSPIGIRAGIIQTRVELSGNAQVPILSQELFRDLEVGKLLVDRTTIDSCKASISRDFERFCERYSGDLKEVDSPHLVDWQSFIHDFAEYSVGKCVYDHMQVAGIQLSNFGQRDICSPGTVIWPLVPRQLATAIHRGQIELIRLMTLIGWRVQVLIADCGDENTFDHKFLLDFESSITKAALRRNITFKSIVRMSTLYDPKYERFSELHSLFRSVSARMTVAELIAINNKGYSEDVKIELRAKTTLTYIRPTLTIAAVMHLASSETTKCAVVSGCDEALQWKQAFNESDAVNRIGALMIPVVKMDKNHQILMQKRWPIWDALNELVEHLSDRESNTAWWIFRLHAYLPVFPDKQVGIGSATVSADNWQEGEPRPEEFSFRELAELVWPKLDPTVA